MRWCLAAFLRLWTNTYCATLLIVWSTSIVVQLLSHVWLFVTLWTAARQASLSVINSWRLLKLMSIESAMPSNCLILCHPLLVLPSIFASIRVFSNESALCIKWPKYWSFSFSPSNEYSVLIAFKTDWFDLLAVQEALESFPSTTVQRHLFFYVPHFLLFLSHISYLGFPCGSASRVSTCNAGTWVQSLGWKYSL